MYGGFSGKIIDKWKFAAGKIIYKCVIHLSQMEKTDKW
jgi:hypothetical protein